MSQVTAVEAVIPDRVHVRMAPPFLLTVTGPVTFAPGKVKRVISDGNSIEKGLSYFK